LYKIVREVKNILQKFRNGPTRGIATFASGATGDEVGGAWKDLTARRLALEG